MLEGKNFLKKLKMKNINITNQILIDFFRLSLMYRFIVKNKLNKKMASTVATNKTKATFPHPVIENASDSPIREPKIKNGICDDTSSCFNYVGSGINVLSKESFRIYPNPGQDIIRIQYPTEDDYTISLFDLKGRLLKEWQSPGLIEVAEIKAGSYLLVIKSDSYEHKELIVIE